MIYLWDALNACLAFMSLSVGSEVTCKKIFKQGSRLVLLFLWLIRGSGQTVLQSDQLL